MIPNELLKSVVVDHPYPLLFATVSGAHLYGFPSADSDFDLRGAHMLGAREVLGLDAGEETVESCEVREEREVDLVTHDIKKFFSLMLKKNGYVLEQLYSPLVVHTTPEHAELKEVGRRCITRYHVHHYLGFAATQWKLFRKQAPRQVKPLLYVYRVLLTGIHLMRTGEVEVNLPRLNEAFGLPYVDDLIARKVEGREKSTLSDVDDALHEAEYTRLVSELEEAGRESSLPERASSRDALNDLLVRLRLARIDGDKA